MILLYVEYKKKLQINLFTKQKKSQMLKTYGYQGGKRKSDKLEIRIDMCILLYQLTPVLLLGKSYG